MGRFDLLVHGPNGYLRRFAGRGGDGLDVLLHERPEMEAVELVVVNRGKRGILCRASLDPAYPADGARTRYLDVAPGAEARDLWRLGKSDRWYDLAVTLDGDPQFLRRFAGKVETGRHGRTDPAIGAMRLA